MLYIVFFFVLQSWVLLFLTFLLSRFLGRGKQGMVIWESVSLLSASCTYFTISSHPHPHLVLVCTPESTWNFIFFVCGIKKVEGAEHILFTWAQAAWLGSVSFSCCWVRWSYLASLMWILCSHGNLWSFTDKSIFHPSKPFHPRKHRTIPSFLESIFYDIFLLCTARPT